MRLRYRCIVIVCLFWTLSPVDASAQPAEQPPTFERDATWPKPLPNNWRLGIVWGVAVDQRDHVWVLHDGLRFLEEIAEEGKVPAPPVLEFDPEGDMVRAWGGHGRGHPWVYRMDPHPLVGEHGINVDHKGNVWVTGGGHLALKFTPDGEFLLQIGRLNKTNGSNDPQLLGNPSGVDFDPDTNEIYIADGYLNQRVIVFDADTGEYKRHWGRYGEAPDDTFEADEVAEYQGRELRLPRYAHAANLSHDKLVYVADREHSSIHVHRPDGRFIREVSLPAKANSVAFSADPEQYYLYAGGMNSTKKIFILRRHDMELLGSFESEGQHFFDVDSKGNLFTCGRFMPQKFVLTDSPDR